MAIGRVNVGSSSGGKRIVSIFAQLSEPVPKRVGDIWVKTADELNIGNAIFREGVPVGSLPDNVPYIQLRGARIKSLGGDGLGFVGVDEIIFGDEAVDESNTIAFWTDKKYEIRGKYEGVMYSLNNAIRSANASFWNGVSWVGFSWEIFRVYYYGSEPLTPFVLDGEDSETNFLNKEVDHLQIYARGRVSETLVHTVGTINVSDFNTLFVRWENLGNNSTYIVSDMGLTTADSPNFIVNKNVRSIFGVKEDQLDISSLKGDFRVTLQSRQTSGNTGHNGRYSDLRVYEIWAE